MIDDDSVCARQKKLDSFTNGEYLITRKGKCEKLQSENAALKAKLDEAVVALKKIINIPSMFVTESEVIANHALQKIAEAKPCRIAPYSSFGCGLFFAPTPWSPCASHKVKNRGEGIFL